MSTDWKLSLARSSRSALIVIKNKTSYAFKRESWEVLHGIWAQFPSEFLGPYSQTEFGSVSSGFMTGVEANVVYQLTRNNSPSKSSSGSKISLESEDLPLSKSTIVEDYKGKEDVPLDEDAYISFKWANPFWGDRWNNFVCTSERFKVECSTSVNNEIYQIVFQISFIPSAESPIKVSSSPSVSTPPTTQKKSWKDGLNVASRSVLIEVSNKTNKKMLRKVHGLLYGQWACLPPETIEPFTKSEFGTVNRESLMPATQGNVIYYFEDEKDQDLQFQWDNPFIGKNVFQCSGPPTKKIEKSFQSGAVAKVTYVITDASASSPISSSRSSINLNDSSISPATLSRLKKSLDDLNENLSINTNISNFKDSNGKWTFNLICLNTMLLQPIMGMGAADTISRATKIGEFILNQNKNRQFEFIALQEVYFDQARDKLVEILTPEYPYIISKLGNEGQSTGQIGGLFFASKHPITWHEFKPFQKGIGPESIIQKGVLGLKVDTSSILKPGSCLYIFNVHLQSTPGQSNLLWDLVGYHEDAVIEIRQGQLSSITKFIGSCLAQRTDARSNVGVLLCGTFNIKGEKEGKDSQSDVSTAISENMPQILGFLRTQDVAIPYAYELTRLLIDTQIPIKYLGILRSQLQSQRLKSFALVEMIAFLMIQELLSLKAMIKSESDYSRYVIEVLNQVLASNSDYFWKEKVKSKLKESFPNALTSEEEHIFYNLRAKSYPNIFGFQLLKSFQHYTHITFKSDIFVRLVQDSSNFLVNDKDIDALHFPYFQSTEFASNFLPKENRMSEDDIEVFVPTSEYTLMSKALAGTSLRSPRDLWRETNRYVAGFTVDKSKNVMASSTSSIARSDYIFTFDVNPTSGTEVMHLDCNDCYLLPTSEQPETQLTDHFGLAATLSAKKM